MSYRNYRNGRNSNFNPYPLMGNPHFDSPDQNFADDMDFGQNEEYFDNRPGPNRQGGYRRGGWRSFSHDEGWVPPPPPKFNRPLFPMGPTWGRGFGPAGPPIQTSSKNMPIRFLMDCGISKEKLKNLPRNLLELITPNRCGVCRMHLESYEMSRAHYRSQFHYTQQKKWMFQRNQQLEGITHQKKEAPLKPREEYCELCDVQITSKVHAESHYSGKLHRGIVQKRKEPKNLRLHKRGMENRIELLIQREKKYLKPVSEVKTDQPEKIQPDLYCEICKTSVTCTEQMTNHLNGKKHLSKEKQHILRMMKTEAKDDKEKADEEADKGEEPESQEDQGDDDEDGDDWINGSGAWDDPQ